MTRSHGLREMVDEPSTQDGTLSGEDLQDVISAADGLQFGDRRLVADHRRGLTTLISPPVSNGFLHGLSTAFRPGAANGIGKYPSNMDIPAGLFDIIFSTRSRSHRPERRFTLFLHRSRGQMCV